MNHANGAAVASEAVGKQKDPPPTRCGLCRAEVQVHAGVVLLRHDARKAQGRDDERLGGQRARSAECERAPPQGQGHGAHGSGHEL